MSRFGVAIVGLGPASQPHARSLMDLSDQVDVRWAASRSRERTEAFARDFPFPVTTDIEAAITDPAVDAVVVLTPPAAHLEVAERCFAAGKHVLVEKPLELTVARGERLVEAGRRSGKRLGVVLQHRFRPASVTLRELLETGRLGTVEAASMTVPWWRPQSYYDEPGRGTMARDGGGVLLTQAIPILDVPSACRTSNRLRFISPDCTEWSPRITSQPTFVWNGYLGSILATTAFYAGLS